MCSGNLSFNYICIYPKHHIFHRSTCNHVEKNPRIFHGFAGNPKEWIRPACRHAAQLWRFFSAWNIMKQPRVIWAIFNFQPNMTWHFFPWNAWLLLRDQKAFWWDPYILMAKITSPSITWAAYRIPYSVACDFFQTSGNIPHISTYTPR